MSSRDRNSLATATNNPWLVLLAVALGQFMVVVDVTILNIALPTIGHDLSASLEALEWAVISYSITMIALVPTLGRLADVHGRKRLYILGLIVFGGASALAALSSSIATLIGARVLQAIGSALITSNTLAILTDVFPSGRRGAAMGVQAILISGGAAIGPVLGGFLVTAFGWEAVFLVNVPVAAVAIAVALRTIPAYPRAAERSPIDWAGAGLLVLALLGLLTAVTRGPYWGFASARVLLLAAAGGIALVGFVWRQRHTREPLLKPALFRIRPLVAGLFAGLLGTTTLVAMVFVLPFYWQALRGETAQIAGMLMLPVPLGIMIASPIAGRLSDCIGSRGLTVSALVVVAIGAALLSQVDAATSIADVLWRTGILGIGLGTFMAPNNNSIMGAAPKRDRGVTSGLLALSRFIGQSLGIVGAGALLTHFLSGADLDALLAHGEAAADATSLAQGARTNFVDGFQAVCYAVIPLALLGAIASSLRGPSATITPSNSSEMPCHDKKPRAQAH